jgi:predicted  nucleic acid-binding Zn-ribbon protein
MKYTILIVVGLLSIGFLGCSTHTVKKKESQPLLAKPKVKKSTKKVQKISSKTKSSAIQKKKIINDYKTTIDKNVAKSKDKQKQLATLKAKREKLLAELKLLQENYSKSKDKTLLNKKRAEITDELNKLKKEYEALKSKVVVVNYTEKTSKKKD